jgi:redox-sensitive bicupin YhaK (pirin superfamily)
MHVLQPREVPLGGLRAMTVRRTLPQRERSLVGAWCFADHYGPDPTDRGSGMDLPPHPHTGLQTVSWLFEGEIEHRDSAGFHQVVRPGEVNLMTAGRGISHSEYVTGRTQTLHGAQLWVALPDGGRHGEPTFEHYATEPLAGDGWEVRVFLGELLGRRSPVRTFTPLLGAQLRLDAGTTLELPVDPSYELGILLDSGVLQVDGAVGRAQVKPDDLAFFEAGQGRLVVTAEQDALLLLLGGPPFGEQIVMWWNFIGRSHDEVAAYRTQWEQLLAGEEQDRFGLPPGDPEPPLHAPELPNVRMKLRGP